MEERKNWFERYNELTGGDFIPIYEVTGNEIFNKKFNRDVEAVYAYCVENNKTWEEVLNFKFDPNVKY